MNGPAHPGRPFAGRLAQKTTRRLQITARSPARIRHANRVRSVDLHHSQPALSELANNMGRAVDDATKVALITAAIANSQIVWAQPPDRARRLPAGFDEVDIAILEWITGEGWRARRGFAPI